MYEEQPARLPNPEGQRNAPAPTDFELTGPYCFRVDQTDQGTERLLSWGHNDDPADPLKSASSVATYAAAQSRIGHRYYGPMQVRVWPQRQGEHYRQAPPQDAYTLRLGDQTDTISHGLKGAVDQLHAEGSAGPLIAPFTPGKANNALYRVHIIFGVDEFERPRSYRAEEWAASHTEAKEAADKHLREYAEADQWTNLRIIQGPTSERVPTPADESSIEDGR